MNTRVVRRDTAAVSLVVMIFVLSMALVAVGPASAVDCGTIDPLTEQPLLATLTLDAAKSDTSIPFRWSGDEDHLQLIYKIERCTLPRSTLPDVTVISKGTPHISKKAHKKPIVTRPSTTEIQVDVPVDPSQFDPGKYTLIVQLTGELFSSEDTSTEVSRFSHWGWALGAAFLGALGALGYTLLSAAAKDNKTGVRVYWLFASALVCLVGGFFVLRTDYFATDLESWTVMSSGWKTLLDAFAVASTIAGGAIATRVLYLKVQKRRSPRSQPTNPRTTSRGWRSRKRGAESLSAMIAGMDN